MTGGFNTGPCNRLLGCFEESHLVCGNVRRFRRNSRKPFIKCSRARGQRSRQPKAKEDVVSLPECVALWMSWFCKHYSTVNNCLHLWITAFTYSSRQRNSFIWLWIDQTLVHEVATMLQVRCHGHISVITSHLPVALVKLNTCHRMKTLSSTEWLLLTSARLRWHDWVGDGRRVFPLEPSGLWTAGPHSSINANFLKSLPECGENYLGRHRRRLPSGCCQNTRWMRTVILAKGVQRMELDWDTKGKAASRNILSSKTQLHTQTVLTSS